MRPLYFLNRYAWPDDSATAQLLTDLVEDQARRGRAVTVLTSRQLYRDPGARLEAQAEHHGVRYVRLASTAFGRDRLVGRAIDYLTFYLSAFVWLCLRLPGRGLLVSLTDPPLVTIVTWLPCLLKGTRQVHWSQDVFPEIVDAVQRPGAVVRAGLGGLRWARDRSLRPRLNLAVIGEDMREHFRSRGFPDERIEVLPNWSSGETVFPVSAAANPLRAAWGLEDAFVLGYSGNLGRVHDYTTFLAAAERLVRTVPRIRFLFIGSGALHERLRSDLPPALLPFTVFQPYQDRALLSQSLSVPDVHWISLQPDCTPLVFPSKFYGVLAAGRPSVFVGDPDCELARIVREREIGAAVAQGDGDALAAAVERLAASPDALENAGRRARVRFETQYDQSLALDRWDAFLSRASDPAG